MESQNKIPLPEEYLVTAFAVVCDMLNWIPLLNIIVTAVTLPAFQLYFMLRGIRGTYSLAGNLIELVPGLSVFPGLTAGIIITFIMHRILTTKLARTALKAAGPAADLIASGSKTK